MLRKVACLRGFSARFESNFERFSRHPATLPTLSPVLVRLVVFGRIDPCGCLCAGGGWMGSMSSIKRDVKKKSSASTGEREDFVSRSSPLHGKGASRFAREVLLLSCLPFLQLSSSGGDHANRVLRHGKRDGCLSGNHGSIGGSWPIAISGYPRRHSV